MKLFFGIAIFVWIFCGLVGAWIIDGPHEMRFKTIARGPISLIKAINDHPVAVPTQE